MTSIAETILDRIVQCKMRRLKVLSREKPCRDLAAAIENLPAPRPFRAALKAGSEVAVIAEIKKASPSRGLMTPNFDPTALAEAYEAGGARALSVITEEDHFEGSPTFVTEVRGASRLAILRKDFLFTPYHIYESRALGADAVLLIARLFTRSTLSELLALTRELGMAALVEVHDIDDLQRALDAGAELLGVNNRDLATMTVDRSVSEDLLPRIPAGKTSVLESGVRSRDHVLRARELGASAVLVGEALLRSDNPARKLSLLRGATP